MAKAAPLQFKFTFEPVPHAVTAKGARVHEVAFGAAFGLAEGAPIKAKCGIVAALVRQDVPLPRCANCHRIKAADGFLSAGYRINNAGAKLSLASFHKTAQAVLKSYP